MTAPLLTLQLDLDTRAFPLCDRAAQGLEQRLDLSERDRSQRRTRKDGDESLAVLRIHAGMIALYASTCNGEPIRRLVFPASSQRLVQQHLILQLRQPRLHQQQLRCEQRALGIQQVEIAGYTVLVAQVG